MNGKNSNSALSSNGFSNKKDQGYPPYFLGRPKNNSESANTNSQKKSNAVYMYERRDGSKYNDYKPSSGRR